MSAAPTIAAIVPIHNGAAHIADALQSIRAQRHAVNEVIVVDDGSTDGTADYVRRIEPRAVIITLERNGPAVARNVGARRAVSDWLGFLDHDDVWPPDRTSALVEGITKTPHVGLIYGRLRIEAMQSTVVDARRRAADGMQVPFVFPAALIRRSLWIEAQGMNEKLHAAEDVELYLRLRDCGLTVAAIDAVTLIYRQHSGNLSRSVKLNHASLLATMHATAVRRRTTPR